MFSNGTCVLRTCSGTTSSTVLYILIDFEYVHVEEAHDKVGSAIATEKTEAKKKIKETCGNQALQAGTKNNHPVNKLCDGTSITHLV